jgi:uncharacterized protein (DUF1697 family)
MQPWLILLRGINVGGHTKVPMAALKTALEEAGYTQVRTYIQSGNVWLQSPDTAEILQTHIAQLLHTHLGVTAAVLALTPDELAQAQAHNPFVEATAADPKMVHICFLSAAPDPANMAALEPYIGPNEACQLVGRYLYVHYGNGAGRTKLNLSVIEKKLGVVGTARNWNTVCTLRAMQLL